MEKVFHVFVSSTYVDLIDERKKVSESVAKAGYVAEGMEMFPASSQKQMDFIERVIDRCDYYILIIAGRYGSLSEDGRSFTEKEFQYAKSKNIPVLAFIKDNIGDLPIKLTDNDAEKKEKLGNFISLLKAESVVDNWLSPDELSAKALAALSQARVSNEGIGWIRANRAAGADILNEINELRKDNSELNRQLEHLEPSPIFENINVAGMEEEFEIRATTNRLGYSTKTKRTISLSWLAILAYVGVILDLSRNCAAPLTAYYAQKENDNGTETFI